MQKTNGNGLPNGVFTTLRACGRVASQATAANPFLPGARVASQATAVIPSAILSNVENNDDPLPAFEQLQYRKSSTCCSVISSRPRRLYLRCLPVLLIWHERSQPQHCQSPSRILPYQLLYWSMAKKRTGIILARKQGNRCPIYPFPVKRKKRFHCTPPRSTRRRGVYLFLVTSRPKYYLTTCEKTQIRYCTVPAVGHFFSFFEDGLGPEQFFEGFFNTRKLYKNTRKKWAGLYSLDKKSVHYIYYFLKIVKHAKKQRPEPRTAI